MLGDHRSVGVQLLAVLLGWRGGIEPAAPRWAELCCSGFIVRQAASSCRAARRGCHRPPQVIGLARLG